MNSSKTVKFCQTLQDCAEIIASLKAKLGANITEPPGLPNIPELRLVTLFTAASTNEMKEIILQEFCKKVLRAIVTSSAFGNGVNIPDISRVIKTGRAGRNGQPAEAILYAKNSSKKYQQ